MSSQAQAGCFMVVAGVALLAYGLWAWHSRAVLSTWLRTEYPTGLPYWITLLTLLWLGVGNIGFGIYLIVKHTRS